MLAVASKAKRGCWAEIDYRVPSPLLTGAVECWGGDRHTMTKADLIEEVSRTVEMSRKDSEVIVETIFESIVKALRMADKIEIRGFGSFRTRERRARVGRNPKTGARVDVPPKRIPFFKPSKELKDLINTSRGASQAEPKMTRTQA